MAFIAFVIHFLLVQLGSVFTLPFGYASVIWPIAGVTLGFYLVYGLPVLIGAFFSTLLCYFLDDKMAAMPTYILVIFAFLNIAKFYISRKLAERYIQPVRVHLPTDIIKFLVITGPIAAFLPAVAFLAVLAWQVNLHFDVLLFISTTKWVGEVVSMVFIAPIILFLTTNTYVKKGKRPLTAALTTLIIIAAIYAIYISLSHFQQLERERQFKAATQPFIERTYLATEILSANLKSLKGVIKVNKDLSIMQFSDFSASIVNEDIKIRALGWLPKIDDANRAQFEDSLVKQSLSKEGIKQLTSSGLVPAAQKPYYLPIMYLSPLAVNRAAIGLDVSSHPLIKTSVFKAIEKKQSVITPMVPLVQQMDKFTGVIVYSPVFDEVSATHSRLVGLVEVVFELDKLLYNVHQSTEHKDYNFKLSYGESNTYQSPSFNEISVFKHTVTLALFDKNAAITFASTNGFERRLIHWQGLVVIGISCFIGVMCVMFVFFIVTYNTSLKKKVADKTKQLVDQNIELTAANKAKNLFLANISHEYRTPLNAIIGFTEIAQREVKEPVALEYLTQIQASSDILLKIVNDVLDTSKIQSGELTLESRAFNPTLATQQVIEMLNEKALEKNIVIRTELAPNFFVWLLGDETRFKQILLNLLSNAIKFTKNGEVLIKASTKACENEMRIITVLVKDNGIGIDKAVQKLLFHPFTQAEHSTTRKYGGTGLGLSIVKQLCVLMNGDIKLKSNIGQGSEFLFNIQLPITEPLTTPENTSITTIHRAAFKNLKVLVVEDNRINQIVVKKQLATLEVTCDIANDGQEALTYLENHCPDIILMDLQMPYMDGFTASKIIKNDEQLKHIPIIILSASVGAEDKRQAAELGIYDFINKPFKCEELTEILYKYVS
ncbi:CHASE domain-containing protein [Litorilituus lipolyticus]|uniref:CHASE domain-containing protein n=1 Tax=Litorilituus lipolyticus TaxID=2491017 RepID=UPI0014789206|nr:ATP-binding protein [Litorilituus lipolyticus]